MSSASRGLAPREGLECLLVKMSRTGPLVGPCRGPQADKSGDPRSQDADSNICQSRHNMTIKHSKTKSFQRSLTTPPFLVVGSRVSDVVGRQRYFFWCGLILRRMSWGSYSSGRIGGIRRMPNTRS